MLDIKLFREHPDVVRKDLKKRGRDLAVVDEIVRLDKEWREAEDEIKRLRTRRNQASLEIGRKKGTPEAAAIQAEMKAIGATIAELEKRVEAAKTERDANLRRMPNLTHESVPVGEDDKGNVTVRTWGEAKRHPFEGKSHVDLLALLDVGDMERAARAAGARFYYLKNELVLLDQALLKFALDRLWKKGYSPLLPPYMLRREAVEGAVDLADFEDVIYKVEGEDLYLLATSEHAIAALHMGEILEEKRLPLRYAGVSPCFRKEAGAHGKDTRGIFRVHQFHKVEQFVFSTPEQSWPLHEELIANAEAIYKELGIPYRVVNICTGDLGTVAAKKYDLEAWMPVQAAYREVVSCSNCTDYQSRRYNTRAWKAPGEPTRFVHTLNATAMATQRTLVAILENFQDSSGTVHVPKALRPYAGFDEMRPRKA